MNNPNLLGQLAAATPVGSGDLLDSTSLATIIVLLILSIFFILGMIIMDACYSRLRAWYLSSLRCRDSWFRSSIEIFWRVALYLPAMAWSLAKRVFSAFSSLSARSRSNRSKNSNCRSSIFFWKRSWRINNQSCKSEPTMSAKKAAKASSDTFGQSTSDVANNVITRVLSNDKS
jgi:hypothetical protein